MKGRLLGLAGYAGSGKDTVANILVRDHGWVKIALADPMKRACAEWFGWDAETLWGSSSARNAPHDRLGGLSARKALQTLGTEFGRACYPDVWVDYAMNVASKLLNENSFGGWAWTYTSTKGLLDKALSRHEGVVISDVRFPNEVAAIRAAGGIIWKTTHGSGLPGAAGAHESERHIDRLEVDAVVPDQVDIKALPLIVTTMLKETLR